MTHHKNLSVDLKKRRLRNQITVIGILAVVYIICHFITGGRLLTPNNLKAILMQITYPMILALGMTFIFSGGMIDLSIGAQAILAGNIGAVLVEDFRSWISGTDSGSCSGNAYL